MPIKIFVRERRKVEMGEKKLMNVNYNSRLTTIKIPEIRN